MLTRHALTTTDNPYDPFTQVLEWNQYDTASGYHTASLLARLTYSSDELSEADQNDAIEMAIDEIIELFTFIPYQKVSQEFDNS